MAVIDRDGFGMQHVATEKLTYTVPEFCSIMGISPDLARKLIREGEIPCINFGPKKKLIPKNYVDRMLNVSAEIELKLNSLQDRAEEQ